MGHRLNDFRLKNRSCHLPLPELELLPERLLLEERVLLWLDPLRFSPLLRLLDPERPTLPERLPLVLPLLGRLTVPLPEALDGRGLLTPVGRPFPFVEELLPGRLTLLLLEFSLRGRLTLALPAEPLRPAACPPLLMLGLLGCWARELMLPAVLPPLGRLTPACEGALPCPGLEEAPG